MATEPEKTFRPWVAVLIGSVWIATALGVWIATRIHPPTAANVSVNTRKISFLTNASHILGPSNEEQLLVSGVASLQIQFNSAQTVRIAGSPMHLGSLQADGGAQAVCSFYQVRSGGFEVRESAVITFEVIDVSKAKSFSLKSHGLMNDNLSTRPGESGLQPGFECRGIRVNGGEAGEVEGSFSPAGGDSIYLATSPDARLDFSLVGHADVSDTQIPVLNELRFSEIDARTSEEKSVLLKPAPEVFFEKVKQKVTLDPADLLVVVPKNNFYLRQFTVEDGVHVSLRGVVREIRSGAGAKGLTTLMPSAFDHMDNAARIYGVIPALAGLVLGILEKMGLLGKK
jgi:hypothetical protein